MTDETARQGGLAAAQIAVQGDDVAGAGDIGKAAGQGDGGRFIGKLKMDA